MKKLKARTLWIICAILALVAIGLIVLVTQVNGSFTKVIIVLIAVDFIALTMMIQTASFNTFKFKPKTNYKVKDYNGKFDALEDNLKELKYQKRTLPYGISYLLIDNDTAYKCSIIKNFNLYFNPEEKNEEVKENKRLNDCTKFIGVEIFESIDEENLKKLPDFTIQGDKVYLTSLLYQEPDKFKCLNYEEPKDLFKEPFDKLINDLGLSEIDNNDNLN